MFVRLLFITLIVLTSKFHLASAQIISGDFCVKAIDARVGLITPLGDVWYHDSKGIIWVASKYGVSYYDGTRVKNFSEIDGLPAKRVTAIDEDVRGNIYVASIAGIYVYAPDGKFSFRRICPVYLPSSDTEACFFKALEAIDTNNIFYGTFDSQRGIAYHFDGGMVQKIDEFDKEPIVALKNWQNQIYLTTSSHVYILHDNASVTILPVVSNSLAAEFLEYEGELWYSSTKLYRLDVNSIIDSLSLGSLTNSDNKVCFIGSKKFLAISVSGYQLYRFDSSGMSMLNCGSEQMFQATQPSGLYVERDGSITVANLSGIFHLKPLPYRSIPVSIPRRNYIFDISKPGLPCLSVDSNLAYRKKVIEAVASILGSGSRIAAIVKQMDTMWYCHEHGLSFNTINASLSKRIETISTVSSISQLYSTLQSKWFWGSFDVIRYKNGSFRSLLPATYSHAITDVGVTHEDNAWILRENGLAYYRDSFERIASGFPVHQFFSFAACDERAGSWLSGSRHSIYQVTYTGKNVIAITDSLSSPFAGAQMPVLRMCFDPKGNLWAAYQKGIVVYFFSNGKPTGRYIILGEEDGVAQMIEDNSVRFARTSDGDLAVISKNCIVFDVDKVLSKLGRVSQALPYIVSIDVNNRPINNLLNEFRIGKDGLPISPSLLHDENGIIFHFSAIDNECSSNFRYQFYLSGLEDNWKDCDAGALKAEYSGLAPGTYIFMLRVANANGVWSSPISYRFTILLPWYSRWWAYLIYVLFIVTVVSSMFLLQQRSMRRRYQTEQMITEQRLIALRAQINSHFLQNTFAFLSHSVTIGAKDATLTALKKVGVYLRNVLYKSDVTSHTLEEEVYCIQEYIEIQQLLLPGAFHFYVDIADDIDIHNVIVPTMLLQPIVENAVKYSTVNGNIGRINLKIYEDGPYVICLVSDNGPLESSVKPTDNHKSKGLAITMRKLEVAYSKKRNKPRITLVKNKKDGHTALVAIPVR